MLKWIPLFLITAAVLLSGCNKKTETPAPEPVPDTTLALPELPELPELDPVPEEVIVEPEFEAEAKPEPKPADPKRGLTEGGAYTLQVGIYNTERQAKAFSEKLKKQGFPAYVARVQDPTPALQGTYYRVRVGAFATSKAARDYGAANLAPLDIPFWADLKGRDTTPVKEVYKPRQVAPAPAPAPAPAAAPAPEPAPAAEPAPAVEAAPAPAPAPAPAASDLPDW